MNKVISAEIPVKTTKEVVMTVPDYTYALKEAGEYREYCRENTATSERQISVAKVGIADQMCTWISTTFEPFWNEYEQILAKFQKSINMYINNVQKEKKQWRVVSSGDYDGRICAVIKQDSYSDMAPGLVWITFRQDGYSIQVSEKVSNEERNEILASVAGSWEYVKDRVKSILQFHLSQYRTGNNHRMIEQENIASALKNFKI